MTQIIDLTYEIEEGMTTFAAHWHPLVSIKQMGRLGFEGRETREISLGTHTGTHIDSPLHFISGGKTINNISLEQLVGDITIIDFSYLSKNEVVTKTMLENQNISKKILFKFGWGKNWGTKEFYKDYPFFSKEAAMFLVSKNVELLAYDTPSPDDSRIELGSFEDSQIHKIFLKNGIVLVEYAANLDAIQDMSNWKIFALPLKIKGSDGSPARVILYK
jgi:arylformamidase